MRECIAFDDVLLVPPHSTIRSRMDPNTSVVVGGISLEIPLISSPMDTVTEIDMAISMAHLGGMGILHRFMPVEEQGRMIEAIYNGNGIAVPAIGVSLAGRNRFETLMCGQGDKIHMVSIDIANGHHILMEEMVKFVKHWSPNMKIMAGNVATKAGFEFLADLGVDAVRVGIGGGSVCKTRIQTGFGMPTLTSIIDCGSVKHKHPGTSIIADGGIRYSADIVKSLVAGADAIMAGGLFSGTDEAPGEIIRTNDGETWKIYRGMASAEVQNAKRGGLKPGTVAEGVSQLTKYKGPISGVVKELVGGLRTGMSYANAEDISKLKNVEMIRITSSGVNESHARGTRR